MIRKRKTANKFGFTAATFGCAESALVRKTANKFGFLLAYAYFCRGIAVQRLTKVIIFFHFSNYSREN
jgi:hypothetical protein